MREIKNGKHKSWQQNYEFIFLDEEFGNLDTWSNKSIKMKSRIRIPINEVDPQPWLDV